MLAGVKPDAAVMEDEIFGPILPVLTVGDVDEAIRFVNDRDKPLALYAFSASDDVLDHVVANTSAGGVTLNHAVLHLAVPDLPFGGVGASGMGAYHGKAGFDTFTPLQGSAEQADPARPGADVPALHELEAEDPPQVPLTLATGPSTPARRFATPVPQPQLRFGHRCRGRRCPRRAA